MSKPRKSDIRNPEGELVKSVATFLISEGYKVRKEVPNLGQSADLVGTRGRWITFLEVKVHDWRSAIRQCQAHKLVADYICLAIGTKNVSAAAREAAVSNGFGLIHVGNDFECSWILKPEFNQAIWRPQRRRLSKHLKALQHVC